MQNFTLCNNKTGELETIFGWGLEDALIKSPWIDPAEWHVVSAWGW